jgi:hypothetical protein
MALRASLAGFAALAGALLAHVAIDFAGDFLLAHDTFDDVAHRSRAVLVAAILAALLALAARLFCHVLDRRSTSANSLLCRMRATLGSATGFILWSAALAVVALAGMELLDCIAAGARVDGIEDLFGGSLALGLGLTVAIGALTGWTVHHCAHLIAEREPELCALVGRMIAAPISKGAGVPFAVRTEPSRSIERALLLAGRGSKRGPPQRALA